jgi:hypothetical protein
MRAYLLTGAPSPVSQYHATDGLRGGIAALRREFQDDRAEALLEALDVAVQDYGDARARVLDVRAASTGPPSPNLVALFEAEVLPRQRAIADRLGEYIVLREETIGPVTRVAEAGFAQALYVSGAVLMLALLASTSLGLHSTRRLVQLFTAEQVASPAPPSRWPRRRWRRRRSRSGSGATARPSGRRSAAGAADCCPPR